MEKIFEKYRKKILDTDLKFVRGIKDEINWNSRLIGIRGARGVGKTTLMLQYIKRYLKAEIDTTLYVSLDNIWFSENKLSVLVDTFVKQGGTNLFIDEVHKYPLWSQELKNIYDDYPELKIVFTGSSMLEILNARADLSRRAISYRMQGLSYREYLGIKLGKIFPKYDLKEIISRHTQISEEIVSQIKPLQYFSSYLKTGYYPFFKEHDELYVNRVEEVVNMILEIELPLLRNVDVAYITKIKQLLFIISQSAPFIPNISKLSERIGINRQTLLSYLFYLNEAGLINSVYKDATGVNILQKPDKVFLENTNLIHAFKGEKTETGNMRETFFVNQLKYSHQLEYALQGDFIIDKKQTFEVGGKNKTNEQIKNLKNAYIVADDIEFGYNNKIPLWLFGFLY